MGGGALLNLAFSGGLDRRWLGGCLWTEALSRRTDGDGELGTWTEYRCGEVLEGLQARILGVLVGKASVNDRSWVISRRQAQEGGIGEWSVERMSEGGRRACFRERELST